MIAVVIAETAPDRSCDLMRKPLDLLPSPSFRPLHQSTQLLDVLHFAPGPLRLGTVPALDDRDPCGRRVVVLSVLY